MSTIKDIAKKLGVSCSTVSRAIKGDARISDKTRKAVLEAVEELNYIPNRFAQELVGRGSSTVGFTIPDINDSFFAKCAVGAEKVIRQQGCDIAYHSIQRNTRNLCDFLQRAKEFRYSSVIITPEYWDQELFSCLKKMMIPTVVLRRKTPEGIEGIPYVDSDHYGSARELCEYLIGLGHRNIAFITFDAIVLNERCKGYKDTMLSAGLTPNVFETPRTTNSDQLMQLGYEATKQILEECPQITAILGGNDMMAIGALQALHEAGVKVPEEMSVAGFDNRSICDLFNIQLTTVAQPLMDLGRLAADMALRYAENPGEVPTSTILKTKLVVRKTTGVCRD